MHDALVVGNGLAGLISARELTRRGESVALLSDGRMPGGHFNGIEAGGLRFDIGMVMLEQATPSDPCDDLERYRPQRRNDWVRFGHLASAWLREQLALRRTPTPTAYLDGRVVPDPIIANRLDVLAGAPTRLAPSLGEHAALHASNKSTAGPYDRASYAQAAAANHGQALHDWLFEPFVRKLTGVGSAQFLARYHRAVWAPLYYPQTLRLALEGRPHGLAEYPFWVPENGCVAEWIAQLQADAGGYLHLSPIAALASSPSGWMAATHDGRQWRARHLVLASPAARCAELLGLPPPDAHATAASVSLWFCSLPAHAADRVDGCRMIVDERYAIYRLTCPERQAGVDGPTLRIVVEANPDILALRHPGADPTGAVRHELTDLLQLERPEELTIHKQLTARDALALPTEDKLERDAAFSSRLAAAAPNAHLTGQLLGYGAASINDQIVQALHIAQRID